MQHFILRRGATFHRDTAWDEPKEVTRAVEAPPAEVAAEVVPFPRVGRSGGN